MVVLGLWLVCRLMWCVLNLVFVFSYWYGVLFVLLRCRWNVLVFCVVCSSVCFRVWVLILLVKWL